MKSSVQDLIHFLTGKVELEFLKSAQPFPEAPLLDQVVNGIVPLEELGEISSDAFPSGVGFYFDTSMKEKLKWVDPTICKLLIVGRDLAQSAPVLSWVDSLGATSDRNKVLVAITNEPHFCMALTSQFFHQAARADAQGQGASFSETTVHPSAVIDPTAKIGSGVSIGPGVVIGKESKIGDGCVLHPGVKIGNAVQIGVNTEIFPNVVIYDFTVVGDHCRLHAGVVLGADGFGYALKKQNGRPVGHEKIIHSGRVVVGNYVEIGANTTIDRGTFSDTTIADQVKIDNQVQIGHNCKIGYGSIICGKVGLSGSVIVGKFVVLAGDVGVGNKVVIGDGAQVGGGSKVGKDIPPGEAFMGYPARPVKDFYRLSALLQKMVKSESRDRKKRAEGALGREVNI